MMCKLDAFGKSAGNSRKINIFFIIFVALVLISFGSLNSARAQHQESVHKKSHEVMPFEMSRTTHIFEMTDNGGIQEVIAKDPKDTEQIRLIQQHLQHEARLFKKGDFSDPASLHGRTMPGLKELAASASKIDIKYSAISNGGRISFTTNDTASCHGNTSLVRSTIVRSRF